jgi:hypothetical protein
MAKQVAKAAVLFGGPQLTAERTMALWTLDIVHKTLAVVAAAIRQAMVLRYEALKSRTSLFNLDS